MISRKSIFSFLAIAFGLAWVLFALPLAFAANKAAYRIAMATCFALAMWGPGAAAILTTMAVDRRSFDTLRLNTLGPRRFYLAAWFIPPTLTLATLGCTLLIRAGTLDPNLTAMRVALTQLPANGAPPPPEVMLAILSVFAVTVAPFINVPFALGEELGWRGYLLPKLMPLGQWKAILLSGAIWGFWHAPTSFLHGYNFPRHPWLGVLVMVVGCTLLGTILAWLYLNTRSPWVAALGHGAINASPGLAMHFLKPGFDTVRGGLILGVSGWIAMSIFIAWLVLTKRLPVAGAAASFAE